MTPYTDGTMLRPEAISLRRFTVHATEYGMAATAGVHVWNDELERHLRYYGFEKPKEVNRDDNDASGRHGVPELSRAGIPAAQDQRPTDGQDGGLRVSAGGWIGVRARRGGKRARRSVGSPKRRRDGCHGG